MSAAKILSVLSGNADITGEVGNRIELVPVKQGTATPHISYEFEGDDPVTDLSGLANITRQDWSIYVTDKSFINAERIKGKVIAAMSSETTEFYSVFESSEYTHDTDTQTHQFTINYRITY